jgi:DNA repair exonuclease SbcCD nuclease subunit
MSTLVTADLHLTDNPRDSYRHDAMETLRNIAVEQKANRVLLLGDLTEEKDRHGAWLVNRVVDHLYELSRICEVIVLTGNHDYLLADSPFYQFTRRIEGIRWINQPTRLEWRSLGACLFLPHTPNWQRDWEGVPLDDNDWVFAHQTFKGTVSDNGHVLEHGVPTNIFGKCQVIAGDVHTPQKVGNYITYVGAPYTVDFGDDYEPRVLMLGVTPKGYSQVQSIPVPGAQKRLIEFDGLLDVHKGANEGDIVKVRVKLKDNDYARWAEIRQDVKAVCEKLGLIVHMIQPVVEKQERRIAKQMARSRRADDYLLRQYVKSRGIDAATAKVGLALLQEV